MQPLLAFASDPKHESFRIIYLIEYLQTISVIQRDQQVLSCFCFVDSKHPWWYVSSNAVWKPTLYLAIKLTYLHVSQTVYTSKAWESIWDKTLKYQFMCMFSSVIFKPTSEQSKTSNIKEKYVIQVWNINQHEFSLFPTLLGRFRAYSKQPKAST